MASLSSSQRRRARAELARTRGVAESTISDSDISAAITAGIITTSDYGSSSSYGSSDSGSSYSSDSGSSFSCD